MLLSPCARQCSKHWQIGGNQRVGTKRWFLFFLLTMKPSQKIELDMWSEFGPKLIDYFRPWYSTYGNSELHTFRVKSVISSVHNIFFFFLNACTLRLRVTCVELPSNTAPCVRRTPGSFWNYTDPLTSL